MQAFRTINTSNGVEYKHSNNKQLILGLEVVVDLEGVAHRTSIEIFLPIQADTIQSQCLTLSPSLDYKTNPSTENLLLIG